MRTGFDNVVDVPAGEVTLSDTPTNRRLIATVTLMTARATTEAATLASHAGRDEVTDPDVIAALRRLSQHFLFEVEDEDVTEAEAALFGGGDEDEGEDDESVDEEIDDSKSPKSVCPEREGPEDGDCTCRVCAGIREAVEGWAAWEPEDNVLAYLKQSTDNVEKWCATMHNQQNAEEGA